MGKLKRKFFLEHQFEAVQSRVLLSVRVGGRAVKLHVNVRELSRRLMWWLLLRDQRTQPACNCMRSVDKMRVYMRRLRQ